jgi:hypothetical protein
MHLVHIDESKGLATLELMLVRMDATCSACRIAYTGCYGCFDQWSCLEVGQKHRTPGARHALANLVDVVRRGFCSRKHDELHRLQNTLASAKELQTTKRIYHFRIDLWISQGAPHGPH